ncbi:MAG TPA: hypothetical protein VGH89_35305 [Pseudonocardia sp.]|jgi:hypothetical protein
MIRRLALSSLIGAAAAASMIAGATPALAATGASGPSVSLAAFASPLPSKGDGHWDHDGHSGNHGSGNWSKGNHFHFRGGHDWDHHNWYRRDWNRHDWNGHRWNWWPRSVSAKQCRDHNGHVDWHADLCIGGRYSGYRID